MQGLISDRFLKNIPREPRSVSTREIQPLSENKAERNEPSDELAEAKISEKADKCSRESNDSGGVDWKDNSMA